MINTKEMAQVIWLTDNINEKKNLTYQMIDRLHAKTETKNKLKRDVEKSKSVMKIDKIVADITLIGYNLKVI